MAPKLGLLSHAGLEAHWRFDDATNNPADLSGNGHTLSLVGSSALVAGPFGNAREVGPGVAGGGNNNYFVTAVDAAANSRMLGEATFIGWAYAPSASGVVAMTSYVPGFGTAGGDSLGVVAIDNATLYGSCGAAFGFNTGALVPIGAWVLIAMRKRIVAGDGYLDYFINGKQVQSEGPFTVPVLGVANRKFWVGSNGKHWATMSGGRLGDVQVYAVALTDEEIFEAWRLGVGFYTQTSQAEHLRVQVKDSGGTWRDLTSYPGFNAVKSASWRADIDDPMATANIQLKRELEGFSLAPLMETSPANLAFNPAGSYAPLLDVAREVKIDVAVVAMDTQPLSADWATRFHGYIDVVDAAAEAYVTLECRDLGAKLADKFIETERIYAIADDGGPVSVRSFVANETYALGEYVIPTDPSLADIPYFYEVTTAGAAGAEPTWPGAGTVGSGAAVFTFVGTTTDNGVALELILQNILDDNDAGVTLYTPAASSWAVKAFIQQREPVLDAIRTLATQNGWDIRYKWNDGTQDFELTLFEPARTQDFANYAFGADEYKTVGRSAMDISRVRNVCKVVYSDPADLLPDGVTKKRKSVSYTDASSVTRFGRRFMEIAEADTSNIDTSTEALRLATAAVLDLKDPLVDLSVEVSLGFPWAELQHVYAFAPNSRHFSVQQQVAVAGFSQDASDGRLTTSLTLRGKPAGRYSTWQDIAVHPAAEPGLMQMGPQNGTAGPFGVFEKVPDVKGTKQKVALPAVTPIESLMTVAGNGWVPSQGTEPGYYRDAQGRVYLEGAIEGGTASPTDEVCQLPYAPLVTQLFIVACNASSWPQLALLLVDTNGKLYVLEGDPTYIYLNQVSYRTDV